MPKLFFTFSLLFLVCNSFAGNIISGHIKTLDGVPAEGVQVSIKGQNFSTISSREGRYEIASLPDGTYIVVVSYAGSSQKEKTITVSGNITATLDFTLHENLKELAEVIVTSRNGINVHPVSIGKINIDPFDNPQSLAVVSQTLIRDQQSQRLSEVIKNVNGVYLATTRGSTQESFSARGYSFSSNNLFKNGFRINTGAMPEMSSIEKVEVLKGSAAILYGNVAPGGIVNMVTKKPRYSAGGEISLRSGSYGLIKPSVDFYGPLSQKVAYRVNGTYEKANSFRDAVKSKRFYVNPSLNVKISPRTELLLQGDYLSHEFTPDFGIGSLDNTTIPDVPRSAFMGTPWQYNKAKQNTATASLKHQLHTNWALNLATSYQLFKRDYYSTERIQAAANGDWRRPLNKIETREDYVIVQADMVGNFTTGKIKHSLLTGVDADKYNTVGYTFNNPTFYDTINILNPDKYVARTDIPSATKTIRTTTPIRRFGAYVQNLISLSDKIKILAGIRWSIQQNDPVTTQYLTKDSFIHRKPRTDKAFTPRTGIVYRPLKNLSLFTSFAQSFIPNNNPAGNTLDPSIVDQYEAGIKTDFFKNKLSTNLTFYKIVNNNLVMVAQYNPDGTVNTNPNYKELTGQTTSNGVELDVTSQPTEGLQITTGYSYNDMRYTKTKQGKGNFIEGERLVNTPAHTGNASLFYTFQKAGIKGLKAGMSFFYTGERFGGWNNTQQQTQNYSRLIKVAGFNTIDLSAGYSFKKLSVLAKISNLFNTYNYYVHENYSINPIQPRQFIATAAYKW